jgi:hypothetical protein
MAGNNNPITNDVKQLQLVSDSSVFRSFSGANIYATIGHRQVATLQAVTVSITREVAALYSFGDANPKAFVRGKRGIAGTLVFTQYDRHALLQDIFADAYGRSLRDGQSIFNTQFANVNTGQNLLNAGYVPTRNFTNPTAAGSTFAKALGVSDTIDDKGSLANELTTLYDLVAQSKLRYTDQIPEFDIHITLINEQGDAAFCAIGGVLLVNEGWGYTLDDLTSESAFTYVAKAVTPLTSLSDRGSRLLPSQVSFSR